MAALAPVLPYLYAATAVVAAVGAVRQGQATAAAEDFNAKIAQQNQQIAEAQGESAVQAQQRAAAREIGAATAAYGASGVQLTGSPLDVLEESTRNSALDAATLRYNYRLKALGFSNQAKLHTSQSGFARSASYLSAGSALLSGLSGAMRSGIQFGGGGNGLQSGDSGQD